METLKMQTAITFNGLSNELEVYLDGGIFFNIDRSNPVYRKLIRLFTKSYIDNRIKLLSERDRPLNAIALIKDYQEIGLKDAKEIYDKIYR